jgi:hypothetical protein
LWGWIFQRERSYLAAATSHALTGVWVVFIVVVPYRRGPSTKFPGLAPSRIPMALKCPGKKTKGAFPQ